MSKQVAVIYFELPSLNFVKGTEEKHNVTVKITAVLRYWNRSTWKHEAEELMITVARTESV
jgi:hypothetical protein